MSKNVLLIAIVAILVLTGAGTGALYFFRSRTQSQGATVKSTIPAGHIVVRGTRLCLPHRDTSGPQTLECALGLKDTQGRYFGLADSDPTYKNISGAAVGPDTLVEVEGTFTPEYSKAYVGEGTILITRMTVVLGVSSTTAKSSPSAASSVAPQGKSNSKKPAK